MTTGGVVIIPPVMVPFGRQLVLPELPLFEPEEGGPQDGVFGEIGAKPGFVVEEGGPQDGVSGEIGAKPGSVVEEGGPQDGVSGEIGAKPGELSKEDCSAED